MDSAGFREIPWNYTSADDERVVSLLLGPDVWKTLEGLRTQRRTGRSAKHLARFFGDLFVLRRNPFLYQDLVTSRGRRREFLRTARLELDTVEAQADGQPDVLRVLERCRAAWRDVADELAGAGRRQRRIRSVLGAVVGPGNVTFDPFHLVSHATDATDWRLYLPLCVAFPTEERQVAPLLAAIARLRLKALPRGAGTGLTGGAVPVAPDCVVVNTERLDRIRGIQPVQDPLPDGTPRTLEVLEVEAGVITEDAMTFAEDRHRVFATDPTSAWASSIGGNIAENAGGKMAVLWGTAIDNLWSWRIAMPGNRVREVRRVGHPMRKILFDDTVRFEVRDEAGAVIRTIDLTGSEVRKRGLWKDITNKALGGVPGLQKEGTDGVVTSARFVLHRPYPHKATFCLEFFGDDNREASAVILALSEAFPDRGAETLMALEHFDEEYVHAIGYRTKCDRGGRPRAVLLIDMGAHAPDQLARGVARMQDLLKPHGNTCLFTAADAAEAEAFWADRKKLGAIARRTNAFKLNEDVVLPLDRLEAFAEYIADYNVAEERHSHRQLASRLSAFLEAAVADRADAWMTPKLARARELLDRAVAQAEASTRKDLRDDGIVGQLRDGLLELFAGYEDIAEGVKARIAAERARLIVLATHMHAGDGNVHVNIPVLSNDREMMRRAADTADTVMRKVVEMGGVVSGEHGIGVTKLLHLDPERLRALADYRREADPDDLMNPGKLSDLSVPGKVFTPSFNLLELEARILKHDSLEVLADRISKCVRCGKCKPPCSTFHPGRGMFFHPRNKNLAIGAVVEALLYDAQRTHSTRFEALKQLEEVADHCTLCHRCLKPCPVDIDTAEVSLLERQILRARRYKHTPLSVRMSLFYLLSKSRLFNAVFRRVVLSWGTAMQRLGARLMALVPDVRGFKAAGPFALLRSPMAKPAPAPLHRALPARTHSQALLVRPEGEARRTVFYFPGCGSERLHTDVSKAALYVLLKSGSQVVMPPPFLCCGFPHMANARDQQQGRQVLQDTIIFSQIREMLRYLEFGAVAVTCGTCMEALRGMGADGVFGTRLVDAGRFALESGLVLPAPDGGDALYHKPCHDSLEGAGVQFLARAAGVRAVDVPHCCSEAGTLPLSRPDIAWNMLDRKALGIRAAIHALALRTPGDAASLHVGTLADAASLHVGTPGDAASRRVSDDAGAGGALDPAPRGQRPHPRETVMLTHCPSCLSGLSRNARLGIRPVHVAVHLAERVGGPRWKDDLQPLLDRAEAVPF